MQLDNTEYIFRPRTTKNTCYTMFISKGNTTSISVNGFVLGEQKSLQELSLPGNLGSKLKVFFTFLENQFSILLMLVKVLLCKSRSYLTLSK